MYDAVVIGAGLGGLECAYLLSKRGMKTAVLEQHSVAGGCLQTFKRRGQTFDTGFHYVGGLDGGQPLNRIFKFFSLIDLPWQKLDTEGFDEIFYGGQSYLYKNGFENFLAQMTEYFPQSANALKEYVKLLKDVGENIFDAFSRTQEDMLAENSLFETPALEYMKQNFSDGVLRNVLSGTSPKMPLTEKLPLYHFAQINSSFIQSAYRLKGGGMQIADRLVDGIKNFGGEVFFNSKVVSADEKDGKICALKTSDGRVFETLNVISDVHPKVLMTILDKASFVRKAQKKRYSEAENSFGMFTVNIALKKNALKYLNRNVYIHETEDIWTEGFQSAAKKPLCALVSFAVPENGQYAENVDILTPVLWNDVEKFSGTKPMSRGAEYEDFKAEKAAQLIDLADKYVSGVKNAADKIYTSTPLTYADYTSAAQGGAYGVLKKMPFQRLASNVYWTGQNVGLHGVLGVSMTAFLTCRLLTGGVPEI